MFEEDKLTAEEVEKLSKKPRREKPKCGHKIKGKVVVDGSHICHLCRRHLTDEEVAELLKEE